MKGGEFLIKEQLANDVFVPEELNEEQLMFRSMAIDFIEAKIWPNIAKIDKQLENPDMVPNLLEEIGDLGMLGAGVPEQYGGMGVDFNTETVLSEELGKALSFGVAVAAHLQESGPCPSYILVHKNRKINTCPIWLPVSSKQVIV